jgi:hypothetical protein
MGAGVVVFLIWEKKKKVGRYLADSAVGTTGGGDNNVLVKQTGTYLVKITKAKASKLTSFLFEELKIPGPLENVENAELVLQIFSIRSRNAVNLAKESKSVLDLIAAAEHWHWRNVLAAGLDSCKVFFFILFSIGLCELLRYFLISLFLQTFPNPKPLLSMWRLVALTRLLTSFADFVLDGSVNASHLNSFRSQHERLSWAIRGNAYNLIEAFGVPDEIMRNPLVEKGRGYEAYLNAMRNNRLNKDKVSPYWKKLVAPLQKPDLYK